MSRKLPTGRWRTLLALSDEALTEHLLGIVMHERKRPAEHKKWARWAGLPEGEVCASPFGARMIALGLMQGATTVLHEQRPLVRFDKATRAVGLTDDPLHGTWDRGVLRTGKYEEFCQEDPFCAYHPEHSSKWAPHEWLHRAVGFFHTKTATRFERYLGARLNELLPVATWYGVEHFLRLDHEGPFDRALEGQKPEAELDRCLWRKATETKLKARIRASLDLVRWTLTRTDSELQCIDRELKTGDLVPASDAHASAFPNVSLDASSDALAYVAAHALRLESEPVSLVLKALAQHRHETLASLRAQIDTTLDQLLFGPLNLDETEMLARIESNVLHDLYLRAATTGGKAWAALAPSLDEARILRHKRLRGSVDLGEIERFCGSKSKALGRHAQLAQLGLPALGAFAAQLHEGLIASFPATLAHLGDEAPKHVQHFAAQPPSRGSLYARFEASLPILRKQPFLRALLKFEHELLTSSIANEPRRHLVADAPHASLQVAQDARCSVSLFNFHVLEAHRGEPFREVKIGVAIRHDAEGISLIELPYGVAADIIRTMGAARSYADFCKRVGGAEIVDELLSVGVLIGYAFTSS
jgi:hypothetical protein